METPDPPIVTPLELPKQVSTWHPKPPDFFNHGFGKEHPFEFTKISPLKPPNKTKSKTFYRLLQGFGNLQQIKDIVSSHLPPWNSHQTPSMDVFAGFLLAHLQLPVSRSSTGPRLWTLNPSESGKKSRHSLVLCSNNKNIPRPSNP